MARRKSRTFTEVELEFMQVLWAAGEATTDEIQTTLANQRRVLTGGSIRNVLAILVEKGYVLRRKQGKTHIYRARVHEDQAQKSVVQDILTRVFDGSESLMVAALLKNRDVDSDEIEEIERLIAERKPKE
ncbi:BlaI/MecI/CopY family transcriptional regulator [Candidatus Latescibacterota bacterium]